jgi:hypothetical protein
LAVHFHAKGMSNDAHHGNALVWPSGFDPVMARKRLIATGSSPVPKADLSKIEDKFRAFQQKKGLAMWRGLPIACLDDRELKALLAELLMKKHGEAADLCSDGD